MPSTIKLVGDEPSYEFEWRINNFQNRISGEQARDQIVSSLHQLTGAGFIFYFAYSPPKCEKTAVDWTLKFRTYT